MPDRPIDKSRIAEWTLALVLPPDQAAAAVGDWIEETPARGLIWFWPCVFRTVFARIRSDLTGNPVTMARIGLWGFARNFLVVAGFFVLLEWWYHGGIRYRLGWIGTPPRWQIVLSWPLLYSARLVQTARWLAKRAPGQELAGFVSVALSGWIAIILLLQYTRLMAAPGLFLRGAADDMILLAAVIWMRRRTIRIIC